MRGVGKVFMTAATLLLTWSAAGTDLTAVLPSYTALTGRIDAAALRSDPGLRALIPAVMPETVCGIAREDVSQIVFASDAKVRRVTVALEAASDEAWQRIRDRLEPYLTAEPGASEQVYRIRNAGKDLNGGFFSVPAARVGNRDEIITATPIIGAYRIRRLLTIGQTRVYVKITTERIPTG